jgi:hypothetical protein
MKHLLIGVYQVGFKKSPAPRVYIRVSDFRAIMALLFLFFLGGGRGVEMGKNPLSCPILCKKVTVDPCNQYRPRLASKSVPSDHGLHFSVYSVSTYFYFAKILL